MKTLIKSSLIFILIMFSFSNSYANIQSEEIKQKIHNQEKILGKIDNIILKIDDKKLFTLLQKIYLLEEKQNYKNKKELVKNLISYIKFKSLEKLKNNTNCDDRGDTRQNGEIFKYITSEKIINGRQIFFGYFQCKNGTKITFKKINKVKQCNQSYIEKNKVCTYIGNIRKQNIEESKKIKEKLKINKNKIVNTDFCKINIDGAEIKLEKCELNFDLKRKDGNKDFDIKIISDKNISLNIDGYGYGEGFPTYGILGGATSAGFYNKKEAKFEKYFNLEILSKNEYKGYYKMTLKDNQGHNYELRQYINISLK